VRDRGRVEALRPFIGLWVAVRATRYPWPSTSPKDVVAWLAQHGQHGRRCSASPDSVQAVTGTAPE